MAASLNSSTKRKRSDIENADPKLKEFLEVMQPASKSKPWTTQTDHSLLEPPTKMQAIEAPEPESDGEYEPVPKKFGKIPPKQSKEQTAPIPEAETVEPPTATDMVMADSSTVHATDDDWLRSRTNRLLDLVEPEDLAVATTTPTSADAGVVAKTNEVPDAADNPEEESEVVDELEEKSDAAIEAIKRNGRLFVRNLPYTATETVLREHFASFGPLEEVCLIFLLYFVPMLRDEFPDRDSLCFEAYDVNWTNILVDASCFLKATNPRFVVDAYDSIAYC